MPCACRKTASEGVCSTASGLTRERLRQHRPGRSAASMCRLRQLSHGFDGLPVHVQSVADGSTAGAAIDAVENAARASAVTAG